jgi:hypothetical protein
MGIKKVTNALAYNMVVLSITISFIVLELSSKACNISFFIAVININVLINLFLSKPFVFTLVIINCTGVEHLMKFHSG